MPSIARRPRRRRLPEAERRAQILRAALEVARSQGLRAVTARSVAEAAGMSQGLVFFHFETTERLLAALVAHLTDEGLAAGARAAAGPRPDRDDPLPAFLAARLAHLDAVREHRTIDLLVEAWVEGQRLPRTRAGVRAAAARYRASFLPIARAAIAADPARFAGVTAPALAALVLSVVLGTAVQAAIEPALGRRRALGAAIRALVGRGAAPGRATGAAPPAITPPRRRPRARPTAR